MDDAATDTNRDVADAAQKALESLANLITNPETVRLRPWLLRAILNPSKEVEACVDEIMDTTSVNAVDAKSLALIVPVLVRGLREGRPALV